MSEPITTEQIQELRERLNRRLPDEYEGILGQLENANDDLEVYAPALSSALDEIERLRKVEVAARDGLDLLQTETAPDAFGFATREEWLNHKVSKTRAELRAALENK